MEQQMQQIRSVIKVQDEDIVIEVFKSTDGAIIRQQSFTKGQLEQTKAQTLAGLSRINGMLALLDSPVEA